MCTHSRVDYDLPGLQDQQRLCDLSELKALPKSHQSSFRPSALMSLTSTEMDWSFQKCFLNAAVNQSKPSTNHQTMTGIPC